MWWLARLLSGWLAGLPGWLLAGVTQSTPPHDWLKTAKNRISYVKFSHEVDGHSFMKFVRRFPARNSRAAPAAAAPPTFSRQLGAWIPALGSHGSKHRTNIIINKHEKGWGNGCVLLSSFWTRHDQPPKCLLLCFWISGSNTVQHTTIYKKKQ